MAAPPEVTQSNMDSGLVCVFFVGEMSALMWSYGSCCPLWFSGGFGSYVLLGWELFWELPGMIIGSFMYNVSLTIGS